MSPPQHLSCGAFMGDGEPALNGSLVTNGWVSPQLRKRTALIMSRVRLAVAQVDGDDATCTSEPNGEHEG
jgi:hypothetical protein